MTTTYFALVIVLAATVLQVVYFPVQATGNFVVTQCDADGYNITEMQSKSGYKLKSGKDTYYVNVCKAVTEGKCNGSPACCQEVPASSQRRGWEGSSNTTEYYSCGAVTHSFVTEMDNGLNITYTGGSGTGCKTQRQSELLITCDSKSNDTTVKSLKIVDECTFQFTMTSPGACKSGGGGGGGFDIGWIIIICFFSLIIVYIIVGMVVNWKVRDKHGAEIFPQYEFWRSFPGLVKDGILFSWNQTFGRIPACPGGPDAYQSL